MRRHLWTFPSSYTTTWKIWDWLTFPAHRSPHFVFRAYLEGSVAGGESPREAHFWGDAVGDDAAFVALAHAVRSGGCGSGSGHVHKVLRKKIGGTKDGWARLRPSMEAPKHETHSSLTDHRVRADRKNTPKALGGTVLVLLILEGTPTSLPTA